MKFIGIIGVFANFAKIMRKFNNKMKEVSMR